MPRFALILGLFLAASLPARADNATVKSVSPEEFEAEESAAQHYTFELSWPDGLTDEAGLHIAAADEFAYLNEKKLETANYVLLLLTDQSPPLSQMAPQVNPLGRYGFKKIVFKHKDGGVPTIVVKEYHAPASAAAFSALPAPVAPLRTLTAGETMPDLSFRPPELHPGTIPPRGRYTLAPDTAVIDASARITAHLFAVPLLGSPPLWANQVEIRSGAWKTLAGAAGWTARAAALSRSGAGATGAPTARDARLVQEPGDLGELEEQLRLLIAKAGGGAAHAPTAAELGQLGPFVDYAFVEPVLVLTTTNQASAFVFFFVAGRVVAIDDLKGLPERP